MNLFDTMVEIHNIEYISLIHIRDVLAKVSIQLDNIIADSSTLLDGQNLSAKVTEDLRQLAMMG